MLIDAIGIVRCQLGPSLGKPGLLSAVASFLIACLTISSCDNIDRNFPGTEIFGQAVSIVTL
jgi:hypothetical protein